MGDGGWTARGRLRGGPGSARRRAEPGDGLLGGATGRLGAHGGVLASGLPGQASAPGGLARRGCGDRFHCWEYVLRLGAGHGRVRAVPLACGCGVFVLLPADAGSAGRDSAPPRVGAGVIGVVGRRGGLFGGGHGAGYRAQPGAGLGDRGPRIVGHGCGGRLPAVRPDARGRYRRDRRLGGRTDGQPVGRCWSWVCWSSLPPTWSTR